MKNKLKFGALAIAAGIVMSSQAFAVTYAPNIDETIQKDNVEALEEEYVYTQTDIKNVYDIYLNGSVPDEEELKKFRPSLEIDQVEDNVYNNNLTDVTDLLDEMLKEIREHQ